MYEVMRVEWKFFKIRIRVMLGLWCKLSPMARAVCRKANLREAKLSDFRDSLVGTSSVCLALLPSSMQFWKKPLLVPVQAAAALFQKYLSLSSIQASNHNT
jgi:hypothetical protein